MWEHGSNIPAVAGLTFGDAFIPMPELGGIGQQFKACFVCRFNPLGAESPRGKSSFVLSSTLASRLHCIFYVHLGSDLRFSVLRCEEGRGLFGIWASKHISHSSLMCRSVNRSLRSSTPRVPNTFCAVCSDQGRCLGGQRVEHALSNGGRPHP